MTVILRGHGYGSGLKGIVPCGLLCYCVEKVVGVVVGGEYCLPVIGWRGLRGGVGRD